MHGLDLWAGEEEMEAALVNAHWKYAQKELVEEQQLIITVGYGFDDLAFKRRPTGPEKNQRCCDVCGCPWIAPELDHRKKVRG